MSVTFYDITLFNLQMSDLAYIDKILVVAFLQVHQNSGLIQLTEIKHRKLKFMSCAHIVLLKQHSHSHFDIQH